MAEVKTLCPFCDYIAECIKPNCADCPIRTESTLNINKQIGENMQDLWASQRSGAE